MIGVGKHKGNHNYIDSWGAPAIRLITTELGPQERVSILLKKKLAVPRLRACQLIVGQCGPLMWGNAQRVLLEEERNDTELCNVDPILKTGKVKFISQSMILRVSAGW